MCIDTGEQLFQRSTTAVSTVSSTCQHEDIELFVIEEALAIPAECFALMDEMMTAAFNPKHILDSNGQLPPFSGKKMIFLGDQAQFPPVGGPAVYDKGNEITDSSSVRQESKKSEYTKLAS